MAKPRIDLLCTGGTIQNPPDVEGYLPADELASNIPELHDVAEIVPTDVSSIASQDITPAVWHRLATTIDEIADETDGVVITSGSNSVEETAYVLNLVLDTDTPVVLTAAQRNHKIIGNDGDKNLLDSVRVAAHPDSAGRGVLVVVNEEIHQAREVTKIINSRPNGWTSATAGALGLLDKYGHLQYYRRTERDHTTNTVFGSEATEPETFPDVEIVYTSANASGTLVDAAVDSGCDGIVLAGFASGHPADPADSDHGQAAALEAAAAEGVPVVITHRGLHGWTYFYPESFATPITEADEHRDDWNYMTDENEPYIWGDNLSAQKARILLALALTETTDVNEIQRYFMEY